MANSELVKARYLILSIQSGRSDGRLIEEAFRQEGDDVEILTLVSPEAALEYLGEASHRLPVLVLLASARFPAMTAIEFVRVVKARPRLCRVPILVFGNYLPPHEVDELFAAHASSVIELPGKLADLENTIRLIKAYWLGIAGLPLERGAVRPQLTGQS